MKTICSETHKSGREDVRDLVLRLTSSSKTGSVTMVAQSSCHILNHWGPLRSRAWQWHVNMYSYFSGAIKIWKYWFGEIVVAACFYHCAFREDLCPRSRDRITTRGSRKQRWTGTSKESLKSICLIYLNTRLMQSYGRWWSKYLILLVGINNEPLCWRCRLFILPRTWSPIPHPASRPLSPKGNPPRDRECECECEIDSS